MQLEAQLARDRSGHAGVCRCSPLKCHTIIESRSDETKGDRLGIFESQTSANMSESTDVEVGGLYQLERSLTGLDRDEHRGFDFVLDLHVTIADVQRRKTLL